MTPDAQMTADSQTRFRRGFMLVTAVFLIPLAAAAIAAESSLIASDMRRTHQEWVDAQLEQLMLAGSIAVKSATPASIATPMTLPPPLQSLHAALTPQPTPAGTAITARLERTTCQLSVSK